MSRVKASHFRTLALSSAALSFAALTLAAPAGAQDEPAAPEKGSLFEEVLVTATKQSRAQVNQKVPVTISAFSGDQIEQQKIKDFQGLAYSIPNVTFESPGSMKSTANFTIRGLGLNSSIQSTTPTVGVFVNGMYMGVNQGVLLDMFDVEGIEVLRGPQGTLFGKNVTGGAVLLNWKKPTEQYEGKFRFRFETGPDWSLSGAVGGKIANNLSGRLAVLYHKDDGYFHNVTLGDKHFGEDETLEIRPSIRWQGDSTDITIFGEYGQDYGDGVVSVAPNFTGAVFNATTNSFLTANFFPERGISRDVYENFRGWTKLRWHSWTANATQDVPFGQDGQVALVMGYRNFNGFSGYASDGTELSVSHNVASAVQEQFSTELRYSGSFGPVTTTFGAYYFSQDYEQLNRQIVINSTQGGKVKERSYSLFGNIDIHATERLTLTVGGRWSDEKKDAQIAALSQEAPTANGLPRPGTFGTPLTCSIQLRTCNYPFNLADEWFSFTPKVGIQYKLENIQFYATAQKAVRSGGFNVRFNAAQPPRAYDDEHQNAVEIGFKSDLFNRRTRLNGALFYTKIQGLQRDITIFDNATFSSFVRTLNTADARTQGFEMEWIQQIIPGVTINSAVGFVEAKYTNVLFDITQDLIVNRDDYNQELPRVTPWTVSAGITATHDFPFGTLTFRGNYSHRDGSYFTDYNTWRRDRAVPKIPGVDLFDAQVEWELPGNNISLVVYGKNLTNQYSLWAFTPIAYVTGTGASSLRGCSCNPSEGRVVGVEANYKF